MSSKQRYRDPPNPLSPEMLLYSYGQGIFPMGEDESDEILWFRPDPRAIIPLDKFHVPRRLARKMRNLGCRVTYNQAFDDVMRGCAENRPVWITQKIFDAYHRLHVEGHAHSVEVWIGDDLVGGLYGVQIGGAFMAESKFRRTTDASKIALVSLVSRMNERGFSLLEVQYLTEHLEQFATIEIPLRAYLLKLRKAMRLRRQFE